MIGVGMISSGSSQWMIALFKIGMLLALIGVVANLTVSSGDPITTAIQVCFYIHSF